MENPTEFFNVGNISDALCRSLLDVVSSDDEANYTAVRSILEEFIKKNKTFSGLQYIEPANGIVKKFGSAYADGQEVVGLLTKLSDLMAVFFDERIRLHEAIADTEIPVIVYQGEEENLPEIFERINSSGIPLTQYEVYAAAWPADPKIRAANKEITGNVIKKYEAFVRDGFQMHGYDRERMLETGELSAFEYLFGLGKYLANKYPILGFEKNQDDDEVNPLSFELVNACLNENNRISTLYESVYGLPDINVFEKALTQAVEFVDGAISPITRFKGNMRQTAGGKVLHAKYQILSMVAATFREMFDKGAYKQQSDGWAAKKDRLAKGLRLYYAYDILTGYWSNDGSGKLLSSLRIDRYLDEITLKQWSLALDKLYEDSMDREEKNKVTPPKSGDYVVLNAVYLETFSAMDQLSMDRFDVEHIAPKAQMKKLIEKTKGSGLAISSIANLCYLPEYANRTKKDRTIYQDPDYVQKTGKQLEEIEEKYTFTKWHDLSWLDDSYEGERDFLRLKQAYREYCNHRFATIKRLFCRSMGIDYEEMMASADEDGDTELLDETSGRTAGINPGGDLLECCLTKIEEKFGTSLKIISRKHKAYESQDGVKGFLIKISRSYHQGRRVKYWYSDTPGAIRHISVCQEKYVVYYFSESKEAICFPAKVNEENRRHLNYFVGEDGQIKKWYVEFYCGDGHVTQLVREEDSNNWVEKNVDEFKL